MAQPGQLRGALLLRAWLYRIATNTGLDALRRRPDRVAVGRGVEVPWLQPFPDELLDRVATDEEEPSLTVLARETIELTFLVAVQHLPPRQRAVLLLRDVLGWSAAQTAEALEQSVPAVNSALQRAHATLRERMPEQRSDWAPGEPSPEDRLLLERYMDAHDRADPDAIAELLGDEMRFTMPPQPLVYEGPDAFLRLLAESFGDPSLGQFKLLPTRANCGELPNLRRWCDARRWRRSAMRAARRRRWRPRPACRLGRRSGSARARSSPRETDFDNGAGGGSGMDPGRSEAAPT